MTTTPPEPIDPPPVDPSSEVVDLYDGHGQVVGRAARHEVRARNLRHGATGILVRNSRGEIYVHRRTDTMDGYPGLYDLAAGGVSSAGEAPAPAAAREAREELGVHGVPLRPLGIGAYADDRTDYVAFVYEVVYDGPITWQPQEVDWGAWLTPAQVLTWLDDPDRPFVPDSPALLRAHVEQLARDGG